MPEKVVSDWVFQKFQEYAQRRGWSVSVRAIEAVDERCYFVTRWRARRVPTAVIESDLKWLKEKLGPNDFGVLLMTPDITGPAEELVAKEANKVALFELDPESGRYRKMNRTRSRIIKEFEEWLIRHYGIKFEEITWPFEARTLELGAAPARAEETVREIPDVVGEPIYFDEFVYAPLNEAGVILLFSKVMSRLGFIYEASPSGFPDLIARRKVSEGRYERVRVEFEYKSSNFLQHKHDPKRCDIIVCWEHDWPDCPLEVIELKSVVKELKRAASS